MVYAIVYVKSTRNLRQENISVFYEMRALSLPLCREHMQAGVGTIQFTIGHAATESKR